MASKEQIKIDEDRVAKMLLKNPSLDLAAIAEACGLTKQKVWRIIRQMEEDGTIISHGASLNMKNTGMRSFLLLFERSFKAADERLMEEMTIPGMLEAMEKENIHAVVEDSYYLTGAYDWAIVITVSEHKDLIKFLELWRKYYGEYFSKVVHTEVLFVATRNSVLNPKLDEIADILK